MYGYGYGYYSMFDPTMILVLIGVFLSLGASAKVKSTYARFSRVRSMTGMTGAEAARQLLNSQGIYDVQIRQVAGSLTDHYDPRTKTVNLSESVYGSTSVAAIGVAAHECGHAMQDASEYVPLRLRGSMVPVVNIGAQLSWPMILIGVLIGGMGSPIVSLGILLFSLSVLFQLVTLRRISQSLMDRIHRNYRFIVGFNLGLILLGVAGILPPTTSALLHNASTLGISLKSMTDLLPEPEAAATVPERSGE